MTEHTTDKIKAERLLMHIEGTLETLFTAQASGELDSSAATSTLNCVLDLVDDLKREIIKG